ncbi:MAG: OmpA family protein [Cyclobacteriaceae bacterium]
MKLILTVALIFVIQLGFAQTSGLSDNLADKVKKADNLFNEYRYQEAVELYIALYNKDTTQYALALKAADCYRLVNDYRDAEKWYALGIETSEEIDPDYLLHYAQSLTNNEHYDEARKWFHKYSEIRSEDSRALKKIASIDQLHFHFRDSQAVHLKEWSINSPYADWSPAYLGDNIVFISERGGDEKFTNVLNWQVDTYNDLFITRENEDGSMNEPRRFHKDINSNYHEGPLVFYGGNKIIFTQNESDGASGGGHLALYSATLDRTNNDIKNVQKMTFLKGNYSFAHPAISPDHQTLYFASDMPGGYGNSDLYKSTWENNKWSTPINLGPEINSEGNESFPFMMNQDELVFSSDGHGGLGGRDLFRVDLSQPHFHLENLGYPFNSSKDDFGYISNETGSEGYVTSNRKNGGLDDDIYKFRIIWVAVEFLVVDDHNGEPLNQAEIKVYQEDSLIDVRFTNKNGILDFATVPDENYTFEVLKSGYHPHTYHLTTDLHDAGTIKEVDVVLDRIPEAKKKIVPDTTDFSSYAKFFNKERLVLRVEDKFYEYREIGDYRYLVAGDEKILLGKVEVDESQSMEQRAMDMLKAANMEVQEAFDINNVYFGLDETDFLKKYKPELDAVAEVLLKSRNVKVEIKTFADSRGSIEYNNVLTFKRAQMVSRYFMSKGVQGSRFFINGYGKQGILNGCEDGVECGEVQHAVNRRAEFTVIIK